METAVEPPIATPAAPPEWQLVVDPSGAQSYYWNQATGETRWEAPPPVAEEGRWVAGGWQRRRRVAETQVRSEHEYGLVAEHAPAPPVAEEAEAEEAR